MGKMLKPIFWTLLFLVMMIAIDQFFVQVPPVHPAHGAVANFYNDFRERLIDLVGGEERKAPKSIEAVIDQNQKGEAKKQPDSKDPVKEIIAPVDDSSTQKARRYIYSDGKGELHFVDSLEEVPDEYRAQAQPMSR